MNKIDVYIGDRPELIEKLEKEAKKLDRSMSWVVRKALGKYFEESDNDE